MTFKRNFYFIFIKICDIIYSVLLYSTVLRWLEYFQRLSMRFYDEQIETASREQIRAIQLQRMKKQISFTYQNVPHYKKKMDAAGVHPDDIRKLEDIRYIPFSTKVDMRDNYPYGLFAVPMEKIVRIHASSGTTGKPTVVGYTREDLDMWSRCIARLAVAAGASPSDIAQISFGYSLFTGAFGLHYGLERLGTTVVPISSGNTERQIMIMKDFGTTLLVSTPSYALYLAETAEKLGVSKELKLKIGMFGGEGMTEAMRSEVESRFGIVATQNYGLSEVLGPGVSGECVYKCGQHINEDYFYPEIIDPVTGEVLPDGATGELVLTPLEKTGIPMLRYRTKDITSLVYDKCECGRTTVRHTTIQGRSDDMLIIRGVNVFPSQIEEVLLKVPEIGPHYEIIVRREGYLDTLEILVEPANASVLENYGTLEGLQSRIRARLRVTLQLDAAVRLVEPNTLKRFEGKGKYVTDLRNLKN